MTPRTRQPVDLVTMGHIRSHGCRGLLIYCASTWCSHHAKLNADWLPDDAVLLGLEPRMVCTACRLIGADVRKRRHGRRTPPLVTAPARSE